MQNKARITTGPNSQPRSESIAQTAPRWPDDTSSAVDEEQVEAMKKKLMKKGKRPEDMPGAEGFLSARADEDTYD